MQPLKLIVSICLLQISLFAFPQVNSPFGYIKSTSGYIEIYKGDFPLVISIPHGGSLLPDEIPERPCTNCSKNKDIFTIEIGMKIREAIHRETGHWPYVIINNLHRTRLDPNRNINEAAGGNKAAELVWSEFQNSIDSAVAEVRKIFGKGLYIDLHGHRHEIKRTELGYLLSSEELQLEDELYNSESFEEYSSIRNLIRNNVDSISYVELIRGRYSLGNLLEEKGYPAVPSPRNPFPKTGDPYFSGGYNTTRHGSSAGGSVDGIQIELDIDLRSDEKRREKFAEDCANVLVEFLKIHYFPNSEFIK
jgi:N-formylglutamate amidohydrolase